MRLRELHPPEAAVGLEESPEFAQHFEASYRPLMETALEHGQPLLVRRGWCDPGGHLWGMVTERSPGGLGFVGIAPGRNTEPEPLELPPVQVYVVEELDPRELITVEVFRKAAEAAARVQSNALDPRFGVVTGEDAYQMWLQRLEQPLICPCMEHDGAACLARLADQVALCRESALGFIQHMRQVIRQTPPEMGGCVRAFRGMLGALSRARNPEAVRGRLATSAGRSELAADVRTARMLDREAGQAIAAWLRASAAEG
jgi:hypothetical protein